MKSSEAVKERKRLGAHMYAERRRANLWAPSRKTLPLQALVSPVGAVASTAQEMASELRRHWAPVSAWKQVPVKH
eukprot:7433503-Pyramimonas_sp.AAC.1